MIGRLAERRKKLPQLRDNYATESEYSSESQTPRSPPTEDVWLLCFTGGGRSGVRKERRGLGGGSFKSMARASAALQPKSLHPLLLSELGLKIRLLALCRLRSAPSSLQAIPLLSLLFFPSSFSPSRGSPGLEAAASDSSVRP